MRDTPKNHILDALPISENRMEKFLSVQKMGGARGPHLGSNSSYYLLLLRFCLHEAVKLLWYTLSVTKPMN